MSRYAHRDISFEPPEEWLETTVARFHAQPAPPGSPPVPCITMEHQRLPHRVTVETHTTELLGRMGRTVQGFKLLNRDETSIGDRPAILLRFRFAQASQTMEQVMAIVPAGPEDDPHIAVFSMACPWQEAQLAMKVFTSVLRTVRFAQSPAGIAPRSPVLSPTSVATVSRPVETIDMPFVPMPGSRR